MKRITARLAISICFIIMLTGCNQNSSRSKSETQIGNADTSETEIGNASATEIGNANATEAKIGNASATDIITDNTIKSNSIQFDQDQLYAVAHLGYDDLSELSFYISSYLNSDNIPTHYISKGDYYLVIPRYSGMSLKISKNDMATEASEIIFEESDCKPFIIQCNVSDIFPDATINLTYNNETAEFSPFISLKDGELLIGERGVDITK